MSLNLTNLVPCEGRCCRPHPRTPESTGSAAGFGPPPLLGNLPFVVAVELHRCVVQFHHLWHCYAITKC